MAAAGVISGGPLAWEIPDAQWDVQFDINVKGVRNLATAAVPALLAGAEAPSGSGGGRSPRPPGCWACHV